MDTVFHIYYLLTLIFAIYVFFIKDIPRKIVYRILGTLSFAFYYFLTANISRVEFPAPPATTLFQDFMFALTFFAFPAIPSIIAIWWYKRKAKKNETTLDNN